MWNLQIRHSWRRLALVAVFMIVAAPAQAQSVIDRSGATNPAAQSATRPWALSPLYAGYAALQALDVYSTKRVIAAGGHEANPLLQHVVGNDGAFWALKISATAGAIVAAEGLWKKNKAAALTVMIVSNGVAATVLARNLRTLR